MGRRTASARSCSTISHAHVHVITQARLDPPRSSKRNLQSQLLSVGSFSVVTPSAHASGIAKTVRDHLWFHLESMGVHVFYDRKSLPGHEIAHVLQAAAQSDVMVVVLDDEAPSPWMLEEIMALDHDIAVQTIFRKDKFRWKDIGKDSWVAKGIDDDVIKGVFRFPAIEYDCHPEYIHVAKKYLTNTLNRFWRRPGTDFQ